MNTPNLTATITEVRSRIERGAKRKLNEQNTKATLIEPVLRALGWNVEDVDEVQREFGLKKRDKPVDYGLLMMRTPRLFVEAKALGENLDDRRWSNQIMGYAAVAGVKWIVLTDGNEYRIYNSHAPVGVDDKLFRTVRLTDDDPLVTETLELLARDRIAENRIDVLWRVNFVDRQVNAALQQLFSPDNDMLLVNYLAGKTESLDAGEIRASLVRCDPSFDFPVQPDIEASPQQGVRNAKARKPGKSPARHDVSVADLIAGGLITPPVRLERTYKGESLSAVIEKDGRIRFGTDLFDSLSLAAGAARSSVIGLREDGRHPATNGWEFWRVKDASGKEVSLGELRGRMPEGGAGRGATG